MDIEEKMKCIRICEKWLYATTASEILKNIYAVMDTIEGSTLKSQITRADEFLKTIKQTREVKEIRGYVKQDREEAHGELSLF